MTSFVINLMIVALFVHTFGNAILTVVSRAVAKVSGAVPAVASLEEACAKVLGAVGKFFKHL